MATASLGRVTFTTVRNISGDPDALQQLKDGLSNAWAQAPDAEMDALYERGGDVEPPAIAPYEATVLRAAVDEIAPTVARILEDALAKRLPWTWEPPADPNTEALEREVRMGIWQGLQDRERE